jgi:hypothetical protein
MRCARFMWRPLNAKVPVISDRDFPYGGGTGTRTPNPLLAKQVRYQLRHAPIRSNPSIIPHARTGIYQSAPGSSANQPCRSTCSRHPSGLRIPAPFYRPGRLRLQLLQLPATSSQAPHSGSVLPEPLCGSVGVPGLEPGTSSLSAKRSNRLSYTPRCLIGPRYDCTAHPGPISNRGISPVQFRRFRRISGSFC